MSPGTGTPRVHHTALPPRLLRCSVPLDPEPGQAGSSQVDVSAWPRSQVGVSWSASWPWPVLACTRVLFSLRGVARTSRGRELETKPHESTPSRASPPRSLHSSQALLAGARHDVGRPYVIRFLDGRTGRLFWTCSEEKLFSSLLFSFFLFFFAG